MGSAWVLLSVFMWFFYMISPEPDRNHINFYNLISEDINYNIHHILFVEAVAKPVQVKDEKK